MFGPVTVILIPSSIFFLDQKKAEKKGEKTKQNKFVHPIFPFLSFSVLCFGIENGGGPPNRSQFGGVSMTLGR